MGVRRASPGERSVQLLLAAGAVALLAIWWSAAGRLSGAGTTDAITAFGRVTGLLGAYACLVVLLLMARVPALERTIGLVRLATWHRYAGTSAVVLIVVHVVATAWGYALGEDGNLLGELGSMIADLPGMVAATVGTGLLVLVALTCARAARRRLPYPLWWLIHVTAYVAVVLGFAHQLDTGDDFVGHPDRRRCVEGDRHRRARRGRLVADRAAAGRLLGAAHARRGRGAGRGRRLDLAGG